MGPMPGNYTRSRQPAPQTVHAVDIVLYTIFTVLLLYVGNLFHNAGVAKRTRW